MHDFIQEEQILRQGGGLKAAERQHEKNRLTARERIDRLIDQNSFFFEIGLWAAWAARCPARIRDDQAGPD